MAAITSAVIGAAAAAVSIGMSVSAANKAAAERAKAEKQAKKAIDEAKKEASIMPGQELSLNLDVYKAEQEAANVAAATSIDAAQQGDRGLEAVAGGIHMANVEAQRQVRLDQISKTEELDRYKADERAAASDKLATIAGAEAEGAAAAAADASARQAASTTQAVQGVASAVEGAANLYSAVQGPYDTTAAKIGTDNTFKKMDENQINEALYAGKYTGWDNLYGDGLRAYVMENVPINVQKTWYK